MICSGTASICKERCLQGGGIFEGRPEQFRPRRSLLSQGDVFVPGKIEEITLDLDLDFVKGLLDDMRRIGVIRRKGAGYRLA